MSVVVRIATLLAMMAVCLSGCSVESPPPAPQSGAGVGQNAVKAGSPAVDGEVLFNRFCVQCHGQRGNGRGSRRGPSLQVTAFKYGRTGEEVRRSIRDGRPGGMPSFSHVVDQRQLDALTDYVMGLTP